jgi:hypothetical protein
MTGILLSVLFTSRVQVSQVVEPDAFWHFGHPIYRALLIKCPDLHHEQEDKYY